MSGIPSSKKPKWTVLPIRPTSAEIMERIGRSVRGQRRHEILDFNSLLSIIEHGIISDVHGPRTADHSYMTGFLSEIKKDREFYDALSTKKAPTPEDARERRFLKITMYTHYLRFVRRKHWDIPEELEQDVAFIDSFCRLRSLCAIGGELTEYDNAHLKHCLEEVAKHAKKCALKYGLTVDDVRSVLTSGKNYLKAPE